MNRNFEDFLNGIRFLIKSDKLAVKVGVGKSMRKLTVNEMNPKPRLRCWGWRKKRENSINKTFSEVANCICVIQMLGGRTGEMIN